VYEGGLTVTTGLDVELQRAANRALDTHLRALDKATGFRKPARNVLAEQSSLDTFRHRRWTRELTPGNVVPALVMGIEGGVIRVRVARNFGTIAKTGYAWAKKRAEDLVKPGDLIEVRVGKAGANGVFDATLEQPPVIEGAVVAIDNHTGQILAMVGGSNFERSQFNRAIQAKRQVGSLFKPFVYTAAIDKGYTAASMLADVKMSFPAGPNQPLYEPQNYDKEFMGPITIRRALETSRNVPAVAMMETLGPKQVLEYPVRLGVTTPLPEFLSVAIGAAEGTLLEMTSAYSAFPNQGVRMTPASVLSVSDREGNILEQFRPEPHDSIRADTAFIMTEILRGVVENGTAASAKDLKWILGGKTGTTDDYTDAWFIGFDADITIGVWLGFDQKKVIADKATGTTVALPMWKDIMKVWVDRRRKELSEPPDFIRPPNVILVNLPTGPEFFIVGTEPGKRP
jgi:penicillin-binding protein 1A